MPDQPDAVVTFHASPQIRQKIDLLTRLTSKPRSVVLRYLIARADPDDLPSAWRNPPDHERSLIALAERRDAP